MGVLDEGVLVGPRNELAVTQGPIGSAIAGIGGTYDAAEDDEAKDDDTGDDAKPLKTGHL